MARNLIKPRTRPKSITAILFLRLVQKLSRPGVIKLFVSIVPASHLQSFFHPNSNPLFIIRRTREAGCESGYKFPIRTRISSPLFLCPAKKALHSLQNQISRLIRIGSRYLPFVSTASENALSPRFFPVFQTPTSIFLSTFLPLRRRGEL